MVASLACLLAVSCLGVCCGVFGCGGPLGQGFEGTYKEKPMVGSGIIERGWVRYFRGLLVGIERDLTQVAIAF